MPDTRMAQFATSDPRGGDLPFWEQRVYFDGVPRRRRELVATLAATPYMTERAAHLLLASAPVADGSAPIAPPTAWGLAGFAEEKKDDLDPEGRWITEHGQHLHITKGGEIDAGGHPKLREALAKGGLKAKGEGSGGSSLDLVKKALGDAYVPQTDKKQTADEKKLAKLEERRVALAGKGGNSRASIVANQRKLADLDQQIPKLRETIKKKAEEAKVKADAKAAAAAAKAEAKAAAAKAKADAKAAKVKAPAKSKIGSAGAVASAHTITKKEFRDKYAGSLATGSGLKPFVGTRFTNGNGTFEFTKAGKSGWDHEIKKVAEPVHGANEAIVKVGQSLKMNGGHLAEALHEALTNKAALAGKEIPDHVAAGYSGLAQYLAGHRDGHGLDTSKLPKGAAVKDYTDADGHKSTSVILPDRSESQNGLGAGPVPKEVDQHLRAKGFVPAWGKSHEYVASIGHKPDAQWSGIAPPDSAGPEPAAPAAPTPKRSSAAAAPPEPPAPSPEELEDGDTRSWRTGALPRVTSVQLINDMKKENKRTSRFDFLAAPVKSGYVGNVNYMAKLPPSGKERDAILKAAKAHIEATGGGGRSIPHDEAMKTQVQGTSDAEAKIVGHRPSQQDDDIPQVLVKDAKGNAVAANAKYVAAVQKLWPQATLHVATRKAGGGERDRKSIIFRHNGQNVGAIMGYSMPDDDLKVKGPTRKVDPSLTIAGARAADAADAAKAAAAPSAPSAKSSDPGFLTRATGGLADAATDAMNAMTQPFHPLGYLSPIGPLNPANSGAIAEGIGAIGSAIGGAISGLWSGN